MNQLVLLDWSPWQFFSHKCATCNTSAQGNANPTQDPGALENQESIEFFSLQPPSKPAFKGMCESSVLAWAMLARWCLASPGKGNTLLWESSHFGTVSKLILPPVRRSECTVIFFFFLSPLNSGKTNFYLGCVIDQRKTEMGSGPTCIHLFLCHHCPLTQMAPLPPRCGSSSPLRYS